MGVSVSVSLSVGVNGSVSVSVSVRDPNLFPGNGWRPKSSPIVLILYAVPNETPTSCAIPSPNPIQCVGLTASRIVYQRYNNLL